MRILYAALFSALVGIACEEEPYCPPAEDHPFDHPDVTQVPLSAYCTDDCPTLAEYEVEAELECFERVDGQEPPADFYETDVEGAFVVTAERGEGCGSVYFKWDGGGQSYSNFDRETGELLGKGEQHDIGVERFGCFDAGFLAGKMHERNCAERSLQVCRRVVRPRPDAG